jgi:hypothetical protein
MGFGDGNIRSAGDDQWRCLPSANSFYDMIYYHIPGFVNKSYALELMVAGGLTSIIDKVRGGIRLVRERRREVWEEK